MRHQLESLILILAVGAIVAIGSKRFRAPYNVALVLVGLFLVLLDVLPNTPLDPEVVLLVFLPLLVFEGALFADVTALRQAQKPILALAVPGVMVSLVGTAAAATWLLRLPFAAALLLGALLAITDTVSVLLAFRSVRVPHRLQAIMEGESLFNDGTALVLVVLTAGILASGVFEPLHTLRALVVAMGGGVILGGAFGLLGAWALRHAPDHLTGILLTVVLTFASALTAERVHASPVIAVVLVGLLVGRTARRELQPSTVVALQSFWETTGFCLNVAIFLLVGMQIRAETLIREASSIALALVALHAGRAFAVYLCFHALGAVFHDRVPMRWQHVMVFGNIKGALSMAAVLALPTEMPFRERLVTIVFGVTFVTLVTQALPFTAVLRKLGVVVKGRSEEIDGAKATLVAARAGQAELDGLLEAGLVSRRDHAERRAAFQREVVRAEAVLRGPEQEQARDRLADLAVLDAQKEAVADAARRGLVASEVAERHINEIDRKILALTQEPHS